MQRFGHYEQLAKLAGIDKGAGKNGSPALVNERLKGPLAIRSQATNAAPVTTVAMLPVEKCFLQVSSSAGADVRASNPTVGLPGATRQIQGDEPGGPLCDGHAGGTVIRRISFYRTARIAPARFPEVGEHCDG